MRRLSTIGSVFTALVLSLVVGIGSSTASTSQYAPHSKSCPTDVFIIGDSLTDASRGGSGKYAPALFKRLSIKAHVYGRNGLSARSALQERYKSGLGSKKAKRSKVWIIALGTNDQVRYGFQQRVRRILKLGKKKTIYWVNTSSPASWQEGSDKGINRVLRQEAKRNTRMHIIDFKRASKGKRKLFTGDRVHMTRKGSKWRAALFTEPFRKACSATQKS